MIKFLRKIMILVLLCFSFVIVSAKTVIYADGYILMEASSKRVLEGKNIDKRYLTASICKVLTGIIVIENCNIDDYVLVTKEAISQEGSKIYLSLNDMITVRDLLYGLLLRSGNDCAYLLANYTCGSEKTFAMLMNKYAKEIGMKNSTFSNPSGLDSDSLNYSTPYDMALLMSYAMKNNVFRSIVSSKNYFTETTDKQKLYFYNKHKLVQRYEYVIGGKTGYTEKSGRTLITYASKDSMELVCVTFKSGNDWNEHISLLNNGFNEYKMENVISQGIIKVDKDYKVTPYLKTNIILPMKKSEKATINIYLLNNPTKEVIGELKIYIDKTNIYRENIYRYY